MYKTDATWYIGDSCAAHSTGLDCPCQPQTICEAMAWLRLAIARPWVAKENWVTISALGKVYAKS